MAKEEFVITVDEEPPSESIPEKALVASVLARGIVDASKICKRHYGSENLRTYHYEARKWINSEEDEAYSFLWCCEELGIDASPLRASINLGLLQDLSIRDRKWGKLKSIKRGASTSRRR